MKKNYYVRYYQTYDKKQTFQQFLQAIASTNLHLHSVTTQEYQRYDEIVIEYTTIWEYTGEKIFLESMIDNALLSKQFNNK